MIQRIQSVYLFVGAVLSIVPLLVGLPAIERTTPEWVPVTLTALYVAAAVLGGGSIGLFRKRELQQVTAFWAQTIALVCAITAAGSLVLYALGPPGVRALVAGFPNMVAVLAPALAVFVYRSARMAIARDIRLLKSADRLRD